MFEEGAFGAGNFLSFSATDIAAKGIHLNLLALGELDSEFVKLSIGVVDEEGVKCNTILSFENECRSSSGVIGVLGLLAGLGSEEGILLCGDGER